MLDEPFRCQSCRLHQRGCICALVERLGNRTPIFVLRHRAEQNRSSNSVRLAALALERLTLVDYGGIGDVLDLDALVAEGTALVFPGGQATLPNPPARLLLLDGTWGQCRRMLQRHPRLAALPRLSVESTPRVRFRRAAPGGVSTLEAIAAALASVGEPEHREPLLRLYDAAVARSRPTNWPHYRES